MVNKNQSAKRLLSFIMALAMIFTLLPTTVFAAESETITLYFSNNKGWTTVNAYAYKNSANVLDTWPGSAMTFVKTNDYGEQIYSIDVPADIDGIIFNNGNEQTKDLTDGLVNNLGFYLDTKDESDGKWSCGTYNYDPGTDDGAGENTPTATYIIAGTAGLCGTEWDVGNTANTMTLNTTTGLYEKTYESVAVGSHSFKVTDGSWTNAWGNGDDSDGNTVFTLEAISNVTITFKADTKEIKVTSEVTGEEPPAPVDNVTIHYRNTGCWSTVNYHAWKENGENDTTLNTWPGEKITESSEHPNWYTVELTELDAPNGIGIIFNDGSNQTGDIMITKSGEYWYDGELLTAAPEDTWPDGSAQSISCKVTLHFANTLHWSVVNLYTWGAYSTGGWPGVKTSLDANGFYSHAFEYEAPEGQGLNFIFSGSGQTVDLKLDASAFTAGEDGVYTAEKWVVPTTTDSEGKYYADIVDTAEAIAISPTVNGKNVTFQYKNADASNVQVFGTMNEWASGYTMSKNSYGVWSVTLEDVAYGLHQYKFVVDGEWINDPLNSWTEGAESNSAFLISNPEADRNIVTIKVHYDAPSAEWNVCAWGADGLEPQYDFTDGVATITLDGRASQYVAFKVRKSIKGNAWAEQSGEIRVDLGSIVSGTIDVYVASDFAASQGLNGDVVYSNKISSVELDYVNNTVTVITANSVPDPETAFSIYKDGADAGIVTSIAASGSTYTLQLNQEMDLVTLYQYTVRFGDQIKFKDYNYPIGIHTVYATDKFANEFTYTGTDLGATYTESSTKFVVWAPTAEDVDVKLYATGSDAEAGAADLGSHQMTRGSKGEWTVTVSGDLKNAYYTYAVKVNGKTVEACDPYARTTGVNGKRAMVVDLDSTDPTNWSTDTNPNPLTSYTDAIIYELHVRDFSIDDSSGVSEANRGKYLAFTEEGTTTANGVTTGIDYLDELGITHLHLLPVYDYGSVDETKCENFNWGYDPVNYNVPEGSYSTNPYDGNVRVNEMKQMIQALHDADISVVMDVVYNHVYDAGAFCYNQIVPGYFSRFNADGSYSNGSGCGNDTASEREMVRKYIVESVLYWTEEYHIDGFRFDLVGLLDTTTINQIVNKVHAIRPDVIFYGEGWTMGTAVEPGNTMATQANSTETPNFAYFSDTIRNLLGGSNGSSLGFVSGLTGQEEAVAKNFKANPGWTSNPTQIIQYASCHDNYTLVDKIVLSTGKSGIDANVIKMNNLAAAVYMTSQGIPFIHAGEEFLREKLEEDGGRCENSYNASDYVNHIEWSNLEDETYAANSAYYQGLIAFRKAHPALRLDTRAEIDATVKYTWVTNEVVMFTFDGTTVADETHDSIVVIFNANSSAKDVTLPDGEWNVCVNDTQAGTATLDTVSGTVSVPGISALVLVQNEKFVRNEDTQTKYASLAAALNAVAPGQTLQLIQDVAVEGTVVVSNNVTLDLNGHTLTTDFIAAFTGSNLVDSGSTKGVLKIAKDNVSLPANNSHMPIWNNAEKEADQGYVFTDINMEQYRLNESYTNGLFEVVFRPDFGKLDANTYVYQFFQDAEASSDNGIQVCLRMSWTGNNDNDVSQNFLYNKALVQEVYRDNKAFSLGVRSMGSIEKVYIQVVVISDTGVEATSSEFSYTVQ